MSVTFNFELSTKANRKGNYPIYLRITQQRKPKRIKTSIELNRLSDWNKKTQEIRKSEPNFKVWNDALSRELEKAKSTYRELRDQGKASSENIIYEIKEEEKNFSFISFADEYAKRVLQSGEYNTYKKYQTFLIKLKFFINGRRPEEIIKYKGQKLSDEISKMNKDLLFSEIDVNFLNRFKFYMQQQPNLRNPQLTLHTNTISKQFDQFASLYTKGIKEIVRLAEKLKNNPFDNFSIKLESTHKEKLTLNEIDKISNLELPKNSLIWHCRNYFIFAFYCAGIRAGDLIELRQGNIKNGRLEYRMGKNERLKSIKLLPPAIAILEKYMDMDNPSVDKYIFPLLENNAPYAIATTQTEKEQLPPLLKKKLKQDVNSKNSLINKYLKKLTEMADINKKITMHIARHSFANVARQKNANVFDISKALGHSSIKITESYLANFDIESQDKTMNKIFDF
jgi:Site-specific recombinase XerD